MLLLLHTQKGRAEKTHRDEGRHPSGLHLQHIPPPPPPPSPLPSLDSAAAALLNTAASFCHIWILEHEDDRHKHTLMKNFKKKKDGIPIPLQPDSAQMKVGLLWQST